MTRIARVLAWAGRAVLAASLATVVGCATLHPIQQPPVAAGGAPSPAFSPDLATLDLRNAAFERAWSIVNDRFYDPQFNGVDWDAARRRYVPEVGRVRSDRAFYALLGRMIGELGDSHTRIYNAHDYRNRLESVISTYGVRVAEVDGKVAIVQVLPDTDAARAGLRRGMVIGAIDGENALARLAKLRTDVPADASQEGRLRTIFTRLISGHADRLTLDIETGAGPRTVSLKRSDHDVPLVVSHETLSGNFGYIAFNKFRPEAAADFRSALADLRATDGLIVDLRGNPGGSLSAMLAIARSFFPETRVVMTRKLRKLERLGPDTDGFPASRTPSPDMRILGTATAYTQPVAILLDQNSASSSELLATILREQRGAAIIGRQTCGCVVAVRPNGYKLPGGGALYVAESGFVSPFGTRMEGEPTQPDRNVPLTLADLDAGVDRDLQVALDWLQQRLGRDAEASPH